MKKLLSVSVVLFAISFVGGVSAVPVPQQPPVLNYRYVPPPMLPAGARIDCPLTSARVEMVTPMPNKWRNTPHVNRLQGTSIYKSPRLSGVTLICKYGNHNVFSIMRDMSQGWRCTKDAKGFDCVLRGRTNTPRAVTHKTGAVVLPQTFLLDLDYGVVRPQGADLWFQAKTATRRYLTPRNGAKLAIAGRQSVNLSGCKNLRYSNGSIALSSVPVDTYICAKTDQGRYSQFRINAPSVGASPGKLNIGYTTWKK